MIVAQETKRVLAEKGTATVEEIADELGITVDDQRRAGISQALTTGMGKWSERVARGRYTWLNGSQPPAKGPSTASELQPLIDALSDVEFDAVGLTYVARTQDGAFICTDQHGVAWRVEVTATARLI